jgi:hypothetical protein
LSSAGGRNTADDRKADLLIPGTLKRSNSYHSAYGVRTYAEIKAAASAGDPKAVQMKKLHGDCWIVQSVRLLQKVGGKR